MAKNTGTEATPCECSKYDALPGDLTEAQIESGDYESWDTGCTSTTRNLFAPGHDAKLKSFLIKHEANGNEIRRNDGGVATTTDAMGHANRYEFAHMVAAGIEKAKAKAAAKAERAAKAAERKAAKGKPAERKLAEGAGIVPAQPTQPLAEIVKAEEERHAAEVAASRPEPEWDDEPRKPVSDGDDEALNTSAREERERDLVQAKIGRWTYQGHVGEDGVFTYRTPKGELKQAAEGKYKVL